MGKSRFGYDPFAIVNGVLSITTIKTVFDRSKLYLTRSIYGPNLVELLWRVPVGADRYVVYRDGMTIGEARGGAYLDRDLCEGIDYAYRVVALDGFDNVLVTAELTVNTDERPLPAVRRPFSLGIQARLYSSTSGEITWDPPNRAVRYEFYRDGEYRRELEGQGYSSLFESGLARDRAYDYRVIVQDSDARSIFSDDLVPGRDRRVRVTAYDADATLLTAPCA